MFTKNTTKSAAMFNKGGNETQRTNTPAENDGNIGDKAYAAHEAGRYPDRNHLAAVQSLSRWQKLLMSMRSGERVKATPEDTLPSQLPRTSTTPCNSQNVRNTPHVAKRNKCPQMGCSIGRFVGAMGMLADSKKQWVHEMRFESLLRINICRIDRRFCKWIYDKFDPIEKVLQAREDVCFKVNYNHVGCVMGIPSVRGHDVESDTNRDRLKKLKELYQNHEGIREDVVLDLLLTEQTDKKLFKQHFLLYALGMILCPIQGGRFSAQLVKVLWNSYRAGDVNWAAYVLKFLVDYAQKKKKGRDLNGFGATTSGMGGCVLFLLVFYLDRLSLDPVNWNVDARINCWNDDTIRAAIKADTFGNAMFGKCKVIDVTYGLPHPTEPDEPLWEDFRTNRRTFTEPNQSSQSNSTVEGCSSYRTRAEYVKVNWERANVRRRHHWKKRGKMDPNTSPKEGYGAGTSMDDRPEGEEVCFDQVTVDPRGQPFDGKQTAEAHPTANADHCMTTERATSPGDLEDYIFRGQENEIDIEGDIPARSLPSDGDDLSMDETCKEEAHENISEDEDSAESCEKSLREMLRKHCSRRVLRRFCTPSAPLRSPYESDPIVPAIGKAATVRVLDVLCGDCDSRADKPLVIVHVGSLSHMELRESFEADGKVSFVVVHVLCYLFTMDSIDRYPAAWSLFMDPLFAHKALNGSTKAVSNRAISGFINTTKALYRKATHNGDQFRNCGHVFVPILFGNHWCVYCFSMESKKVIVFDSKYEVEDSYHMEVKSRLLHVAQTFLNGVVCDGDQTLQLMDWEVIQFVLPFQEDDVSCGIFAMFAIHRWEDRSVYDMPIKVRDVMIYRRYLLSYLLEHRLNEVRTQTADARPKQTKLTDYPALNLRSRKKMQS